MHIYKATIDRRKHVLIDADDNDNVNDNSDISLALDVLLSEHRGCPTKVSFCCSVGFSADFEKRSSFDARRAYSVSEGKGRVKRRSLVP